MNGLKTTAAASLVALAGVFATANDAEAQQQMLCGPSEFMENTLKSEFGATLQSERLSRRGVVELYANEDTGVWTDLLKSPDGQMACILDTGPGYSDADSVEPNADAPEEQKPEVEPAPTPAQPEVEAPRMDL
jgi:hypothetical protein